MKPYPYSGAHFLEAEICVKSKENLVIEFEATVEVRVYHPDLKNNKSYLFHPNSHKELRVTFMKVTGMSKQLKIVALCNEGQLPKIIQKNEKIRKVSQHQHITSVKTFLLTFV